MRLVTSQQQEDEEASPPMPPTDKVELASGSTDLPCYAPAQIGSNEEVEPLLGKKESEAPGTARTPLQQGFPHHHWTKLAC